MRKWEPASRRSSARKCGFAGPLKRLKIYERAGALKILPYRGRAGRIEGTRELPLPSLPFIVIYRVLDRANAVEIVNIIHGAQRWPPSD